MNTRNERKSPGTNLARAAGALIAVALAGSAGYLAITDDGRGDTTQAPAAASKPSEAPRQDGGNDHQGGTLGDLWRLVRAPDGSSEEDSAGQPSPDEDARPFTEQEVRESLRNVRLDGNGDVILDDRARQALNRSLEYGRLPLDEQSLAQLQRLIRTRLPGKAGEQTARVVGDYYRFLQAKEQYMKSTSAPAAGGDAVAAQKARYEQVKALRAQYLGPDVASQLFRTTDANAEYMFRAHQIQQDPDLTDEEKVRKANELHAELQHDYVDIDNWDQRHARFQAEKARILEAGLSEADKRAQVQALLQETFGPEELARIEHLKLGEI